MTGGTGHNNIRIVIAKNFEIAANELLLGNVPHHTAVDIGKVDDRFTTPLELILEEALKNSPLKAIYQKIYDANCRLIQMEKKQDRYMLCLHIFGQTNGQDVYRMLKPILAKIC